MIQQTSILFKLPTEVVENIVLEVTVLDTDGPPSSLIPLLCTCKHLNELLASKNAPNLYARIFKTRFDIGAARRRFGAQAIRPTNLTKQLKIYSENLLDIRRGDIYSPHIHEILRTAFFIAMESDGKNGCQLQWARLGDFIDRFVRARLCDGAAASNGWPAENSINALALWLLWFTTTREQLLAESTERRQQIIDLVLPYVILPFRYPSAHAPQNHFELPLATAFNRRFPHSVLTAHGPFPLYREVHVVIEDVFHYGINLEFSRPLVTVAAKMLYFSRRETIPIGIPPHLPIDRAHAIALGHTHVRPTQADVHEVNAHQTVKMVTPPKWDYHADLSEDQKEAMVGGLWTPTLRTTSAMWDNDWNRSVFCFDPWQTTPMRGVTYTHGIFNGLWQGRMLVPEETAYRNLVFTGQRPGRFGEGDPHVTTVPVFMRLREHHCISPQVPIPAGGRGDGFDDGLHNAWMPKIHIRETQGDAFVTDQHGNKATYHTFVPGAPSIHSEETCTHCIKRRLAADEEMRVRSAALADADMDIPPPDAEMEDVFTRVGLGRGHECEDTEMEDDADDSDAESDAGSTDSYEAALSEPPTILTTCSGIQDLLLTGETDIGHGQAWNHYIFYGRVRMWDGLIALVRVPRPTTGHENRSLGRWVFTGYVVGAQNFVGTWRALNNEDVGVPTWESAFCMSRRE